MNNLIYFAHSLCIHPKKKSYWYLPIFAPQKFLVMYLIEDYPIIQRIAINVPIS